MAMRNAKKGRAPVYGYLFDRELPGNKFKAYHAADLWYMFGNMDRCWRKFEQTDFDLSAQMIEYVAQFAKSGNPNREGLPEWQPVTKNQKGFRLFDGKSDGYIYPFGCRKKMWHTFLKDKGPM
jgi:para-nitrobenzyl esterase